MKFINVNIINMNNGSSHGPQIPGPRPPEKSGRSPAIFDLLAGVVLTWLSEPWMPFLRGWLTVVLIAAGVPPAAAPAVAVVISITGVCIAPAVLRWVLRKILK